ncbi:hypothetical protein L7F22_033568 [Adiantum nelumboides]|nr:hypothetical protein [Adiantum nelumboides]
MHEYHKGTFVENGNAYLFYGGSDGMHASALTKMLMVLQMANPTLGLILSIEKARIFLVLPVAILDAFFILWIFMSLSKTLEKLQARRMVAKLELYKKFTNILALFVIIYVAWIGYEIYFKGHMTKYLKNQKH